MQKPVGSHARKCTYDQGGAASNEAVTGSGERARIGIDDETMKEEGGADEICVGNVERIENHRERKKDVICDMHDLLGMFPGQQGYSLAEHIICISRILHDKVFALSRFREMVSSFEDRRSMLSRETENLVDRKVFIKINKRQTGAEIDVCGTIQAKLFGGIEAAVNVIG